MSKRRKRKLGEIHIVKCIQCPQHMQYNSLLKHYHNIHKWYHYNRNNLEWINPFNNERHVGINKRIRLDCIKQQQQLKNKEAEITAIPPIPSMEPIELIIPPIPTHFEPPHKMSNIKISPVVSKNFNVKTNWTMDIASEININTEFVENKIDELQYKYNMAQQDRQRVQFKYNKLRGSIKKKSIARNIEIYNEQKRTQIINDQNDSLHNLRTSIKCGELIKNKWKSVFKTVNCAINDNIHTQKLVELNKMITGHLMKAGKHYFPHITKHKSGESNKTIERHALEVADLLNFKTGNKEIITRIILYLCGHFASVNNPHASITVN